MTIFNKPDLTRGWASSAIGANITDPDSVDPGKYAQGWVYEVPPFQYFNFLQNQFSEGLAYLNQQGTAEWDAATEYPIGAIVKASDGMEYQAKAQNTAEDPTLNLVQDIWRPYVTGSVNVPNENLLENTGFTIGQRYSFVNNSTLLGYAGDRWKVVPSGGATWSYSANFNDLTPTSQELKGRAKVILSNDTVTGFVNLLQRSEFVTRIPTTGKMTLSYWAKADVDTELEVSFKMNFGTGGSAQVDEQLGTVTVLAGVSKLFVHTFDIPADWTTKTVGSDDFFQVLWIIEPGLVCEIEMAEPKLERGPVRTQYVDRTVADDLQRCYRYLQHMTTDMPIPPLYNSTTTLNRKLTHYFPVRMRTTPTMTVNHSGFSGVPTFSSSTQGFIANGTATSANGQTILTDWTASAEL